MEETLYLFKTPNHLLRHLSFFTLHSFLFHIPFSTHSILPTPIHGAAYPVCFGNKHPGAAPRHDAVVEAEADLVLSRLGRGDFQLGWVPVVLLAFHVDYWDYMGWKDPYGSSQWTVRQKAYVEALGPDSLFTPQVVVQGKAQLLGNDEDTLTSAITSALSFPALSFQLNKIVCWHATFNRPTSDSLEVTLNGALRTKVDSNGADVMVALYETSLITDCPRGENKGRFLSNDYVVRKLEKLRTVKDHPAKKIVSGTLSFSMWETFNSIRCGLAVFVQSSSYQILGS